MTSRMLNKYIAILIEKLISKLFQFIGIGTYNTIQSEVKSVKEILPSISSFVDCGGNIGDYSDTIIRNFGPQSVFVFEPSKLNFDILKNRFIANDNIVIINCALSNNNEVTRLFYNFNGSGLASLTKRNLDHRNISFSNSEEISTVRLEDYWNSFFEFEYLDFLKIDVEGHELDVLAGLGEKIKSVKVIQFEFGGCNIDTKTTFLEFWTLFKIKGFTMYRISPMGLIHITEYNELYEAYTTTNYLCVNRIFDNVHP